MQCSLQGNKIKKTCHTGQVREIKQAILPVHSSYLRGYGEHFMGGDLAYQENLTYSCATAPD
jgi:hypothetical protein